MQSFFIWNGVDCRSMGVYLTGPAAIIRGEERVQHITIPGRAGELTLTEGENIFNSYIQTLSLHVKGGYRVREILKWLRGSGYVTFSGEPDRRQKARVIGAVTLNKHSRNLDIWTGEAQFYCEPLKELLHEESVTVTTSGAMIYNQGDVLVKPRVVLTPTSGARSITVTMGGKTLSSSAAAAISATWIIDSAAETVTDTQGNVLTGYTSGDFPVLPTGGSLVTGSGWDQLEILRRERYL